MSPINTAARLESSPKTMFSARHLAEGYGHQRGLYATGYFTKEDQPNYTQ